MPKRRANRSANQPDERQTLLLEQLKEIAVAVGLEVREEKLVREAGYTVRSGLCKVNGQEVLILDKNIGPGDRIDVLTGALARRDLDAIYIEPALRELITGGAKDAPAT